jgi:hypothetical protein
MPHRSLQLYTHRLRFLVALAATLIVGAANGTAAERDEWRFHVMLDDKDFGYHRFTLNKRGDEREVTSEARYNYKLLFISAYKYTHDAREIWRNNCLTSITSTTDDNGTKRTLGGTLSGSELRVSSGAKSQALPACVMTFAYWNPEILKATHLLNSDTGEYSAVRIDALGNEQLNVRGKPQAAQHYRIVGDKLKIDLWYSVEMRWLALEADAEGNRRLRYQLQ